MNHDELLEDIDEARKSYGLKWDNGSPYLDALRAVVEKHHPFTPEFGGGFDYCFADDRPYPCPTIQAIEKEL
jgi:hypothetical protein